MSQIIPECLTQISSNEYQCSKYGFIIKTDILPIRCNLCEKKELPSITQMATNFITDTAKHVKNGLKKVSVDEYARRMELCNSCPFLTENRRCSQCGCFMQLKAWRESSECPIGVWQSGVLSVELNKDNVIDVKDIQQS